MEKKGGNIILFVGSYPPRECGIATFTKDLTDAIDKKFNPFIKTKILAMNNNGVNIYNYKKKVIYQLGDTEKEDYIKIAEKINSNNSIKLICIQHEFGIFGGELGEYLISFLKTLKKPKIITFHSILPKPNEKRMQVVRDISENVDEIIVMTQKGIEILKNEYNIQTPIKVIPHGIPTVAFESQFKTKKTLGYQNNIILSSFGMINSGKGYEYVIEALPEIVKKYPNLIYLIVGATHPIVRRNEGESYRNFLGEKVKSLSLEKNVKFYNKYTTLKEIIYYLKATDVYISSSLTPEQITSGTLVYAMGCGRATISTPFLHAQDVINHERGILLNDFRNPESFKEAILKILSDRKKLKEIEQNSYSYTRHMTWPNVAIAYGESIRKYIYMPEIYFEILPKINTKHIRKMTDNFGIMQFSKYTSPDIDSGYTLDDNARALIVAGKLYLKSRNKKFLRLISTYLSFIRYVLNYDGKLFNIVSKEKMIDKNSWSEEAQGRAIKSLGYILSIQGIPENIKKEAKSLFFASLSGAKEIKAPRALSSLISGLYYYNKENYSQKIIGLIKNYSQRLVDLYESNKEKNWKWFEPVLTYSNCKIPRALLHSYIATQDKKYLDIGLESLNFLLSKTFEGKIFVPIGQNGWYKKEKRRSYFDQQPIDAASMVETLTLAYKITNNPEYEKKSLIAFNWFLGNNTLNQIIYDEQTGGCYDGLGKEAINLNQGAESTLSYLTARLTLEEIS
ncbi:MAG: glycosyltransferase [Candidatus Pacearchaeota archaeon]